MKVIDLNGNVSIWKVKGSIVNHESLNRSEGHIQTRALLKDIYPTVTIIEEVPINATISSLLYLDFYMPLYKTAIEVHGKQHFEFIQHFHRIPNNFLKQKARDQQKAEWCELNNIQLITLAYNEDINEWIRKLSEPDSNPKNGLSD